MGSIADYAPLRMAEAGAVPTAAPATVIDHCGLLLPHTQSHNYAGASWQVLGRDSQLVMVNLKPDEELMMEPGALVHANEGVEPNVSMGGCKDALQRSCCAGESLFRLHYKNKTRAYQALSLTPAYPAKVVPVDLTRYSGMTIQKMSYFATTGTDLKFSTYMPAKIGACIGGGNLLMTRITGSGIVFLSGGGTIVQKQLAPGEKYVLDTDCFMACEHTVSLSVRCAGDFKLALCGGKGIFNTELQGPGLVIFQSMPAKKAAAAYFAGAGGGGGDGGGGDGGGGG